MSGPVMIMAGGTGGHIFPGLELARVLRERAVPVLWLGSDGGLETRLVPAAGIELETLPIAGLRGKGLATLALAPFRLGRALWRAWRLIRRRRPRCVLSLGGFAAGPGGLAAWISRRPLLVHEQNRIPGLTNRVLAQLARRRLCGFAGAFAAGDCEAVGNPVRREIAALPAPAERWRERGGRLRLLVLGGSQGARALNRALPVALAAGGLHFEVRHQCGARFVEEARAAYAEAAVAAEVTAFIDDMAAAYGWADLAVCRAGALTLAELAAAGLGALLVPYPHAVDDHQTRNAEVLVAAGGARCLPEQASDGELSARLTAALAELASRPTLLSMAEAARTLACPQAAERLADACLAEARA